MQVLYNKAYGQFVLLFHADTVSFDYNAVGVAVSASVRGPYRFVRTFHPDGLSSYDMGTFQVSFSHGNALCKPERVSDTFAGRRQMSVPESTDANISIKRSGSCVVCLHARECTCQMRRPSHVPHVHAGEGREGIPCEEHQ